MRWEEATLPAEAAVTNDGRPDAARSFDDVLRGVLGVSKWNPQPTLLYFHTPHDDADKKKLSSVAAATKALCRTVQDETVCRWLNLFRCVEVDMGASDPRSAERLGRKEGVLFSVVDQDLRVLATGGEFPNAQAVVGFLRTSMKSEKLAAFWDPIQKDLDAQQAALKQAKALEADRRYQEALQQYAIVVQSNLRIGDWWDKAVEDWAKLRRKVADK